MYILVNRKAGNGNAEKVEKKLVAKIIKYKIDDRLERIIATNTKDELIETAKKVSDITDLVFLIGGDGSVNDFVNGYMKSSKKASLAVMPGGSGNAYYYALNGPALDKICENIKNNTLEHKPVDVIRIISPNEIKYAAAFFGIGFDGEVVGKAKKNNLKGLISHVYASFASLNFQPFELEYKYDDKTNYEKAVIFSVNKSLCCGGGIVSAPYAELDDGLLDVIIFSKNSSIAKHLLTNIFKKNSKHVNNFKCSSISIKVRRGISAQYDGEEEKDKSDQYIFEVVPKILKIAK